MVKEKTPKHSFLAVTFVSCTLWLTLFPVEDSTAEAALNSEEELTASDQVPVDNSTRKRSIDLRKTQGWEKRLLGETFSQNHFQKNQSQNSSLFHLKSPGKLPGIEFGIEMHSIQAFQSVVPSENLPKALEPKREQPLLLSPSINAPDYNGGFFRFTW
jgi:hypothetical protein